MLTPSSIRFPSTHAEGWIGTLVMWLLVITPTAIGQSTTAGAARDAASPPVVKSTRPESGARWAVIIGISNYADQKIPGLNYCVDDAELLVERLAEQCDYAPEKILLLTEHQTKPHLRPTSRNLKQVVKGWVNQSQEGDTVLVFFSGHGFLDRQGRGFLATEDCDPSKLEETALRIEDLREILRQSKAKQKLLVLDCCHAGAKKGAVSEKIDSLERPSSEELGASFASAEGLITLASCRKQESSFEWKAVNHGIFTWFLANGIAGMADSDKNGLVDSDELYQYTVDSVVLTARREFGGVQTPIRIGEEAVGRFVLAGLRNRQDRLDAQNAKWLEQRPRKAQQTSLHLVKYSAFVQWIEGFKGTGKDFNRYKNDFLDYLKEEHDMYKQSPIAAWHRGVHGLDYAFWNKEAEGRLTKFVENMRNR